VLSCVRQQGSPFCQRLGLSKIISKTSPDFDAAFVQRKRGIEVAAVTQGSRQPRERGGFDTKMSLLLRDLQRLAHERLGVFVGFNQVIARGQTDQRPAFTPLVLAVSPDSDTAAKTRDRRMNSPGVLE
jgi:hypothetical protein